MTFIISWLHIYIIIFRTKIWYLTWVAHCSSCGFLSSVMSTLCIVVIMAIISMLKKGYVLFFSVTDVWTSLLMINVIRALYHTRTWKQFLSRVEKTSESLWAVEYIFKEALYPNLPLVLKVNSLWEQWITPSWHPVCFYIVIFSSLIETELDDNGSFGD